VWKWQEVQALLFAKTLDGGQVKKGYLCDSCGKFTEGNGTDDLRFSEDKPWSCPVCGKEACSKCYWKYGTHKKCCEGKTNAELSTIANSKGFDFELTQSPA